MSRNVGLVAVGVDRTGMLRTLGGAASGAVGMAGWLRSQEIFGVKPNIKLLTDADGGHVSAREVQDAVRDLIAPGDLHVLILYFAGHGIVKAGGDEQILLSDVANYLDEAIAIAPTLANAYYSTVPHVIVISDACRNSAAFLSTLDQVEGKPAIIRGPVVGANKSKVDVFYATEPSQTAKEFEGEGFFTKVLLDTLVDPPDAIRATWPEIDPKTAVVPAWTIGDFLEAEVPIRAAKEEPPFDQTPDIRVYSHQPKFFGFAAARRVILLESAPVLAPAERELEQNALRVWLRCKRARARCSRWVRS